MNNQDDDFTRKPEDGIYDPADDRSMKTSPDEQTPATPPTNTSHSQLPLDDPRTDYKSDIDEDELYDAGLTTATGADDSTENNTDYETPVEKY